MLRFTPLLFLISLFLVSCESGEISTTDPNGDDSNPTVRLAATFNDDGTTTIDVESDSPLGGGTETVTLPAGTTVLLTSNVDDPQGVKETKIWPVGVSFTTSQLQSAAYENSDPMNAFTSVDRLLTYEVEAGREARFFANARNFGGGFFGTTTAGSGTIIIQGSGSLPALPAGHSTQDITLAFNSVNDCYESPMGGFIPSGATIVGVAVINAPSTDCVSLTYSTVDPTTLDTRLDFERVIEGTGNRVNFFNGPWGAGRWFGIRGIRKSSSGSGTFRIRVYYTT